MWHLLHALILLWFQVSLICEILFMAEVLITCFTTFINDEGIVISELKSIWHNYWSSGWFFVDLVAAIPWELVFILFGINDVSITINSHFRAATVCFYLLDSRPTF